MSDLSHDRYRSLVEASPDAIVLADESGRITYVNERVTDLFGYRRSEIHGESVEILLPQEKRAFHEELRREYMADPTTRPMGVDLELAGRHKDGTTIPVDVSLSPIETGDGLEVMAVVRDISERTALEKEHRSILAAVPDAVIIADIDTGEILAANDQVRSLFGYEPEELVGMNQAALHPAEDRERYRRIFDEAIECREALVGEFPDGSPLCIETKQGDRVPVEINSRVFEIGDETRILGVFRDVSKRHAYERQLERAHERLASILDAVPVPLALADFTNGNPTIDWVNEIFEEEFGHEREDLAGASIDRHIVPDALEDEAATINDRLRSGEPVNREVTRRTKGGEYRDFLLVATPLVSTDRPEVIGAYVDITEQKRALRKRALLSDASRAVGEAENFVEATSEMVELLCGYTEWSYGEVWVPDRDANRLEFVDGYTAEDDLADFLDTSRDVVFSPGEGLPGRVYSSADGEWIDDVTGDGGVDFVRREEASVAGLHAAFAVPIVTDNDVLAVLAFFLREPREEDDRLVEDVRDVVRTVEGLAAKKHAADLIRRRNEQLENFAAIISHDLRNPLNVAQGYLEMVRAETEHEHLAAIEEALARLEELFEDMLALAKQGRAIDSVESVSLSTCAERCWATADTAEATLTIEGDRTIRADRSRLEQLLENLFRNAVVHGGSDVDVRVGATNDGFYIADDGAGIPASQRGQIFDLGFTTAEEGTGFGMAIVTEIVDAHGWDVRVAESDAGGARFEISGVGQEE